MGMSLFEGVVRWFRKRRRRRHDPIENAPYLRLSGRGEGGGWGQEVVSGVGTGGETGVWIENEIRQKVGGAERIGNGNWGGNGTGYYSENRRWDERRARGGTEGGWVRVGGKWVQRGTGEGTGEGRGEGRRWGQNIGVEKGWSGEGRGKGAGEGLQWGQDRGIEESSIGSRGWGIGAVEEIGAETRDIFDGQEGQLGAGIETGVGRDTKGLLSHSESKWKAPWARNGNSKKEELDTGDVVMRKKSRVKEEEKAKRPEGIFREEISQNSLPQGQCWKPSFRDKLKGLLAKGVPHRHDGEGTTQLVSNGEGPVEGVSQWTLNEADGPTDQMHQWPNATDSWGVEEAWKQREPARQGNFDGHLPRRDFPGKGTMSPCNANGWGKGLDWSIGTKGPQRAEGPKDGKDECLLIALEDETCLITLEDEDPDCVAIRETFDRLLHHLHTMVRIIYLGEEQMNRPSANNYEKKLLHYHITQTLI